MFLGIICGSKNNVTFILLVRDVSWTKILKTNTNIKIYLPQRNHQADCDRQDIKKANVIIVKENEFPDLENNMITINTGRNCVSFI